MAWHRIGDKPLSESMLIHCCTCICGTRGSWVNSLRPRQNGCQFADDTYKCIFLNENVWIAIKISLKFVLKGPINNIPALVQIMAWRRPGDKPLSGPMMVRSPTHICVTRPQWVNSSVWYTLAANVMESPTRWLHGFIFRPDFEIIRDSSYKLCSWDYFYVWRQ